MQRKVTVIPQTINPITHLPKDAKVRRKVAAYARVSTDSEEQLTSYEAQVDYYTKYIKSRDDWEFVNVYTDEGISAVSTNHRDGFKQMIADALDGKISLIITKSVSRFARNTVDSLTTIRKLKEKNVECYFEKENIWTFDSKGEFMLTILASFAQEEVRSISENVKWGTRKRFEQGIPNGKFRVYGYEWQGDRLVPIPEEAAVVKRIFQNFIDGKSRLETEREFEAEGITTRAGCKWIDSNIRVILTNITYTGNMLLQKEYVEDPITKHKRKNRGELPQYFVEGTHEPIIDMETFQWVQAEMKRRRELGIHANKSLNLTCFSGIIKCCNCGRSYVRSSRKRGNYVIWTCTSRKSKGKGCGARDIPEKVLKKVCADVLEIPEFDSEKFSEQIEHIEVKGRNTMIFYFFNGTVQEHYWTPDGRKTMWTPERRALWSEYNLKGGREKLGIGFREYVKENTDGKNNENSCNDQPLHSSSD